SRINYGPFQFNENGTIWGKDVNAITQQLFGPVNWNPPADAPSYCHFSSPDPDMSPKCGRHFYKKGLISGAHMNGVEVYPVIGGPDGSDAFSELASNPEAREMFAENVVQLMINYDFDGLDIAWQVRLALNKVGQEQQTSYGLTSSLPCSHDNMEYIDIPLLSSLLSEFNLLSFDFSGPWDNKVGINSPLYDPSGGDGSIDSCVMNYIEGGAPRNKINIGLAFYGHSFVGGKFIGDECTLDWAGICSDTQSWQADGGSPQYHNVYNNMPKLKLSFDLQTKTPLASNERGIVSFDDPRSICLKTEYAISNELGGFIIMDLTGDMLDDRSTPLLDAMNLKLFDPDINCGGEEFEDLFEWRAIQDDSDSTSVFVESSSDEPSSESYIEIIESNTAEYRYTCGNGEGNARDRCNSPGWDDINCDHGTCPGNMLCMVVLCTKPREHGVQGQPSWSPSSKSKPKHKPLPLDEEIYTLTSTKARPVPSSADEIPPREEMEVMFETSTAPTNTAPAHSAPTMSFSCGVNFHHAESCGKPCPNGLADCPSGQFCFWLECEVTPAATVPETTFVSIGEAPTIEAPTIEAPTIETLPIELPTVTTMKYQCGETRDVALTCSEECGYAWGCPEGKDCYNVPCSL
ncbi:hypothetical protein ACHAXR_004037, partial [Thalassiosira sp. AJA248-18]